MLHLVGYILEYYRELTLFSTLAGKGLINVCRHYCDVSEDSQSAMYVRVK
jgi:hypothetical protein